MAESRSSHTLERRVSLSELRELQLKAAEHPMNQSKSKQKWSFSKADRFLILPKGSEVV